MEIDKTLAEEAVKIVGGDRPGLYGDPEDNFANIAAFWNAHLRTRYGPVYENMLDAKDVAAMMVGTKMAREAHLATRDNKVDAIGYILTLDRCERYETQNNAVPVKVNDTWEDVRGLPVFVGAPKVGVSQPPESNYPNRVSQNERDVKLAASKLREVIKLHTPEDHGPEFWSSDCDVPVCVAKRVSFMNKFLQAPSIHEENILLGNSKHYMCGCNLSYPGTGTW